MELEAIRDVFYWIQVACVVISVIMTLIAVASTVGRETETIASVTIAILITFILIMIVIALLKAGMNIQECYQ